MRSHSGVTQGAPALVDVLKEIGARWRLLDASAGLPHLAMLDDRQLDFVLRCNERHGRWWLHPEQLGLDEAREMREILLWQIYRKEHRN